jgi:uncharacterized protein YbjT (DUF2867 family)
MPETSERRALVVGATGVVGREITGLLLAEPGVSQVTTWLRRAARDDAPGHRVIENAELRTYPR